CRQALEKDKGGKQVVRVGTQCIFLEQQDINGKQPTENPCLG
ncbi:MAG: hypothetical protein RLZZ358_266, partial [Bacteroidota bacterium]